MSFEAKAWRALTCVPPRKRGRCSSVLPAPNLDRTQVELQKPFWALIRFTFARLPDARNPGYMGANTIWEHDGIADQKRPFFPIGKQPAILDLHALALHQGLDAGVKSRARRPF